MDLDLVRFPVVPLLPSSWCPCHLGHDLVNSTTVFLAPRSETTDLHSPDGLCLALHRHGRVYNSLQSLTLRTPPWSVRGVASPRARLPLDQDRGSAGHPPSSGLFLAHRQSNCSRMVRSRCQVYPRQQREAHTGTGDSSTLVFASTTSAGTRVVRCRCKACPHHSRKRMTYMSTVQL